VNCTRQGRGAAAGAGSPDETESLAGRDMQVEILEYAVAVEIAEADILERDRAAEGDERLGVGRILDLMRQSENLDRLAELGEMLYHLDQRHGEVARRMQHGETERRRQHDVAGGDLAGAPQRDRPDEDAGGDGEDRERMENAQPLQ